MISTLARLFGAVTLTLLAAAPAAVSAATLNFSGYQWEVRNSTGGPGPNTFDARNAWVDEQGHLHLRIAYRDGRWTSAEVGLPTALGFGTYQFKLIGRPDRFDQNVVLGLFNYTRPHIGPDGTNEIDIEFAKWGNAGAPIGNWTVYPAYQGPAHTTHPFPMALNGDYTTHRFTWSPCQVNFVALHGHQDTTSHWEIAKWAFAPRDFRARIPQEALPVHLNFWLFRGQPPVNGQEVEIEIAEFKFIPGGNICRR